MNQKEFENKLYDLLLEYISSNEDVEYYEGYTLHTKGRKFLVNIEIEEQ